MIFTYRASRKTDFKGEKYGVTTTHQVVDARGVVVATCSTEKWAREIAACLTQVFSSEEPSP